MSEKSTEDSPTINSKRYRKSELDVIITTVLPLRVATAKRSACQELNC